MKEEYRKIQGVNPCPSLRQFKHMRSFVPRDIFWDIFVTPNDGGDDHLLFTLRAIDMPSATVTAKQRLMEGAKWKFFDLSTIRAVEVK